jgi:4-diphosphocytidyl-2-C-methyl-D-erythritol kinase
LIAFPNCKINLGLNIIRKRKDNYHNIETVFYPLDFTDVLEIVSNENKKNEFTVTGLPAGKVENNLCSKAYDLLKKHYPQLPSIKLHLHKAIPIGAGLGGGSADAAFSLQLLDQLFSPGLTIRQLKEYALQLGSDCPFFLYNKSCFASGRGENIEPLNIDLSMYKIVLINPGIHIATSWAFSNIKPSMPPKSIKEVINQPIETWQKDLINDFELPVLKMYTEIKSIKEILYNNGALYASLSGSGSSVYGIFGKFFPINTGLFNTYFTRVINMK